MATVNDIAPALDDLLAGRTEPPTVLALGEPAHGVAAFPLLRNELLAHLGDRGYRSIALETDHFAASAIDDYVNGGAGDIETVLETGFSHRFGTLPENRALVEWLRAHNADRAPADRIRFYGFDAPTEYAFAPSPRRWLTAVLDQLPDTLRPVAVGDLDTLLGDDAGWTNEAAMYDPAASIGTGDAARTLRIIADDLASALHRAGPLLPPADYDHATAHARTALGLLRYHAAMATPGPDRMSALIGLRAEMMADNLLAIVARERQRGPTLVHAHNVHLLHGRSGMSDDRQHLTWCSAGALARLVLGERYLCIATDGHPNPDPDSLQGRLAETTTGRALFPIATLRAALPEDVAAGPPMVRGHIPLTPADLAGADAIVYLADTDGRQHRFW